MSSQNQGASLSSFADLPVKRKRGRPCKDPSVRGENTPVTPEYYALKSNKQSVSISDHACADMLGQIVSGVIEGSFDAGYLLNVKVGDTNTYLRGAVFLPGLFAPITGANDVAPRAKMYERKDIPIPFVNLQGHLHVVSPSSGKSEIPFERKIEAPNLPDQGPLTGLKPGASVACNLPINESGLPLGQKVIQEQSLDSGLRNEKAVGQNQSLQGFEAFKLMKGPNVNVEAAKASKSESINLKPQVEHQVLSYDLIPQELIHDDAISLEPEPQAMACDTGINLFGKHASLRQEDTQLELAQNIMNGANTSHMDGLSASDDVRTTSTAPFSSSMNSLPVMIFGAEAKAIPFEPKYAPEESLLPTMIVPEVNTSLMTANTYTVESNAKDAF